MLYSELKERKNRFITSLKIGFPFLILALFVFYFFFVEKDGIESFLLFIILIPIYIYYVFYLIYNGFKSTLIDSITKTFNRKEIIEIIEKKKFLNRLIVLIKVANIIDINERYGISNADNLIKIFTQRLDEFLNSYNFKNIPIGRYSGGHFLFVIKAKEKELTHLLTIFLKELKNIGINDIEIKIEFSMIESSYDYNVDNSIKKLLSLMDEKKDVENIVPNIKPNEFESIIVESIEKEKFIYKYQPAINLQTNKIDLLEVLTKIYSKSDGMLAQSQIQRVINYLGYETVFDKKNFSLLLKELEKANKNNFLYSIKISSVTLRNSEFRQHLSQIFFKSKLKAENFILEFSEKSVYEELHRFKEILTQYQKIGFKIGLDNFGGDNASLEYIKNLPIDIIKFDLDFTKKIYEDVHVKMLKSYIDLLRDLNVLTVVKFIDKEETYKLIDNLKPDYIQGFIVSKPKNLKQIGEN